MRLWRIALVIGLAVAVVDFPRALEPGRSEQAGVALNNFVDQGQGAVANDWFSAGVDAKVATGAGNIRLEAGRPGYQLVSRQIAVFPHQCYVALARARVLGGSAVFKIFDGEIRSAVTELSIPVVGASTGSALPFSESAPLRVSFDTSGLRRVTLVLVSASPAVIDISSVSFVPGPPAECPAH